MVGVRSRRNFLGDYDSEAKRQCWTGEAQRGDYLPPELGVAILGLPWYPHDGGSCLRDAGKANPD